MGYHRLSDSEKFRARFHYLLVYEARGFFIDGNALAVHTGAIEQRTFRCAAGNSVNAICRSLVDDDFIEDEGEWSKEHRCTSPYLVVHLGPTSEHAVEGSHIKFDGQVIHTYDGFPSARAELREWEAVVAPPLLAGLASSFSLHDHSVKFVPMDRAFFGVTNDGRTTIDMRVEASGTGYAATHIAQEEANERAVSAIQIASGMRRKVAQFIHLALEEDDLLKRFLYFFLAVEIETHATFATINHAEHLARLVSGLEHAAPTAQVFLDSQRQKWTSLADRFVWCVLCRWHHVSDADVEEFKRLKTIRDQISHGALTVPSTSSVMAMEKLATKLQSRGGEGG